MVCDGCCINNFIYAVGLLVIVGKITHLVLRQYLIKKRAELKKTDWKKDVVYFYQLAGTESTSSCSPFCIKVEAYLRLHNIKFERIDTVFYRGVNGLLPFIELNGKQYADSQFAIFKVAEHFNIKDYESEEKAAIGRVIDRACDVHTFNCLANFKLGAGPHMFRAMFSTSSDLFCTLCKPFIKMYYVNGASARIGTTMGPLTNEQYKVLLHRDMHAIQTILGNKPYLLGDKPTLADCTAFSQFGGLHYLAPGHPTYINDILRSSEFSKLHEFLERFKKDVFKGEFHA